MELKKAQETLVAMVAGNSKWKNEAMEAAIKEGYEIKFRTSSKPIGLKAGEVAFSDNGLIAILSFDGDVTEEIKREFSEEDVEEIKELFSKESEDALLLKAEKKN